MTTGINPSGPRTSSPLPSPKPSPSVGDKVAGYLKACGFWAGISIVLSAIGLYGSFLWRQVQWEMEMGSDIGPEILAEAGRQLLDLYPPRCLFHLFVTVLIGGCIIGMASKVFWAADEEDPAHGEG